LNSQNNINKNNLNEILNSDNKNKNLIQIWSIDEILFNLLSKKREVKGTIFMWEIKKQLLKDNLAEKINEKKNHFELLYKLQTRWSTHIFKTINKSDSNTASKIKTFINNWNKIINNLSKWIKIIDTDIESFSIDWIDISNTNSIYETILKEEALYKKWIPNSKEIDIDSEVYQIINKWRKERWISNNPINKWIPLINETFIDKKEQMLDLFIEELWFIPEDLYTKLKFNSISFNHIADFYKLIRKKEKIASAENNIVKLEKIKHIRLIFLKYIFLEKYKWENRVQWICESQKSQKNNQIILDTNWVWIKVFSSSKSKYKKGSNPNNNSKWVWSHIPYSLCDEKLVNYWHDSWWINQKEYLEISKQKFAENKEQLKFKEIEKIQLTTLAINMWIKEAKTIWNSENISEISKRIIESPEKIANIVNRKSLIVPQNIYDYILKSENLWLSENDKFHKIFVFAEAITANLLKEELFDNWSMFKNYNLATRTRNLFQTRSQFLQNNPKQYNTYKALQTIFSSKLPSNSIKDDFIIFRWKYETQRKNQSFIEIIHNNTPSRILLSDEKHLPRNLMKKVDKLPTFEKTMFENIELLMRSYSIAKIDLNNFEGKINNIDSLPWEADIWKLVNNIHKSWINILLFILNYLPEKYDYLNKEYLKILTYNSDNIDKLKLMLNKFLWTLKVTFEELNNNLWKSLNDNNNVPWIKTRTLNFNKDYLENIEKNWLKDYAYNKPFFDWKTNIKIVTINDKEENPSVSYMNESIAIKKLHLNTHAPLLIASWWCKNVNHNWKPLLETISEKIVKVWGKHSVNLSIPCTQSWIWNSLWWAYINYKELTSWISESKKMQMFAIAPWKIMYDPENEIIWNSDENKYAPSPVDQIYINYSADWNLVDKSIIKAWYFQFIEAAESIYNRLDENKNRTHIVMNWWLFSIAEVIAALKNWAQTLFIKWTGRLADVTASIYENIWEFVSLSLTENNLNTMWDYINYFSEFDKAIKKNLLNTDYDEFKNKDWWNDIELSENSMNEKINSFDDFFDKYCDLISDSKLSAKHILYRIKLRELLLLSLKLWKKPQFTDVNNLEDDLEKSFS